MKNSELRHQMLRAPLLFTRRTPAATVKGYCEKNGKLLMARDIKNIESCALPGITGYTALSENGQHLIKRINYFRSVTIICRDLIPFLIKMFTSAGLSFNPIINLSKQ
ncbi:hypothetical protein ACOJBQ_003227 [Cronobacter muytjensii]